MKKMDLDHLKEISDLGLAGLKADEAMRYRIIHEASGKTRVNRPVWFKAIPAAAAMLVFVLGFSVVSLRTPVKPMTVESMEQEPSMIRTMAAGYEVNGLVGASGVKDGSVNASNSGASVNSIWENGSGSSFPMIGIDGQYYRMLKYSGNASMLTSSLGSVLAYTSEPALAGGGTIVSNVCPEGTPIYAVAGIGGTVIGAEVNGSVRLFQRVSFNGSSIKGGEQLADTLQIAGHVASLQLGGVGTVTDGAAISNLVYILLNQSSYQSAGSVKASQYLIINLNKGISLQLAVKDDMFSACGTWSNPDFFAAFRQAAQ